MNGFKVRKKRELRVNGVLYQVQMSHHWSEARLARSIYLAFPNTIAGLMAALVGSEKLERQLLEPQIDEQCEPGIVTYFRISLISDLRLRGWMDLVRQHIMQLQPRRFLLESALRRYSEMYYLGQVEQGSGDRLKEIVAESIALLRGHTAKERKRIKGDAMQKVEKRALVRQLRIAAQERRDRDSE